MVGQVELYAGTMLKPVKRASACRPTYLLIPVFHLHLIDGAS